MFRKPYYGSKIAPACAYCLHGAPAADPKMILVQAKRCSIPLLLLP